MYSAGIRWVSNQLVSATKLGQMNDNELWTKACADRCLVHCASGGPYERGSAAVVVTDFVVTVTFNSVVKTFAGGSGVSGDPLGSAVLADWDISAVAGDGDNLTPVDVKVDANWFSGMHTVYEETHQVPMPNEAPAPRYDYLSALIDVSDASWTGRLGMCWTIGFWVHAGLWSSAWSVEEVA